MKALFSPDGRTFAVLVAEASAYAPAWCLQIFDAESGKEIAPFLSVRNANDCAFLFMDYDILLYEGTDSLTSYDLTTGKTVVWTKAAPSSDAQTGLALSADGKVVAYVVWETLTAYIFNAQTQALMCTLSLSETSDAQQTPLFPMEHMVALNDTGSMLAVSLPDGGISLFPTDSSEPTILLNSDSLETPQHQYFEGGFYSGYFFYAKSDMLASGYEPSECRLIDLDTMEAQFTRFSYAPICVQADENGIYLSRVKSPRSI